MPDSVGSTYRAKLPQTLPCGTFGMTEATGIVATGGYAMDPELGFTQLGFPLTGVEVRIVDLVPGRDLPTGERGEVLTRGYTLFCGYSRGAERTGDKGEIRRETG